MDQNFFNRILQLQIEAGRILVIGYAPSVLISICTFIEQDLIQSALIIAMPIGFSHAPTAKRRLMQLPILLPHD